jgi:hypothetical protein
VNGVVPVPWHAKRHARDDEVVVQASSDQFTAAVLAAGRGLGLGDAEFAEVAAPWTMSPFIWFNKLRTEDVTGCLSGTWRGRAASVSVECKPDGTTNRRHLTPDTTVHWVVTSVAFKPGITRLPFLVGIPSEANPIGGPDLWSTLPKGGNSAEGIFGEQVPVPQDFGGVWHVRARDLELGPVMVNALNGLLPVAFMAKTWAWRIDGAGNKRPHVDLVRIDHYAPLEQPPTQADLAALLDHDCQLTETFERTLRDAGYMPDPAGQ